MGHSIPAAVPAEIAERQADRGRLFDAADRLTDARAAVRDKLLAGKKVGRFVLSDVFDCGAQEEMKYREMMGILETLAIAAFLDLPEVQNRVVKLVDEFIDRSMGEEIEAQSIRIQEDEESDALDERARLCGAA